MLCNSFANMNSKPFKKFYLVKEATYLRNKEKEKEKEQPLLGLQINHGHDLKVANTVKGDSNINCEHQDEKQANTKTFHDTKVIPTSSHVQTQAPPTSYGLERISGCGKNYTSQPRTRQP